MRPEQHVVQGWFCSITQSNIWEGLSSTPGRTRLLPPSAWWKQAPRPALCEHQVPFPFPVQGSSFSSLRKFPHPRVWLSPTEDPRGNLLRSPAFLHHVALSSSSLFPQGPQASWALGTPSSVSQPEETAERLLPLHCSQEPRPGGRLGDRRPLLVCFYFLKGCCTVSILVRCPENRDFICVFWFCGSSGGEGKVVPDTSSWPKVEASVWTENRVADGFAKVN